MRPNRCATIHAAMSTPNKFTSTQRFWHQFLIFILALGLLHIVYYDKLLHPQVSVVGLGGEDAVEYEQMGTQLYEGEGVAGNKFGLRPPSFPLFIAGVYQLVGRQPYIVVYFQLVLAALSISLTYKLAYLLLQRHNISLLASTLLAFEVAHLDTAVTVMSEPLHNTLFLAAVFCLAQVIRREKWLWLTASALLISLAMLTRAGTVYFVVVAAFMLIAYRPRIQWRFALVLVLLCAIPYLGWSYRNQVYRNSFSYSTSGPFVLLFYRAVSVEYNATGVSSNEIAIQKVLELERRLGNTKIIREDVEAYPVGRDIDRFSADAERESLMNKMAVEVFQRYPIWYGVVTVAALVFLFVPSNLRVPDWLHWVQSIEYLLLALLGVWFAYRRRYWLFLWITGLCIAFFVGTNILTFAGLWASRYRTPFMPFVVMYTALGIIDGLHLLKQRPSKDKQAVVPST